MSDFRDFPICDVCGWKHDPTLAHMKTKYREPKVKVTVPGVVTVDPFEKFKDWEERAKASPTTETDTGRKCESCGYPIVRYKNFLGIEWEAVGDEPIDEHARKHQIRFAKAEKQELPDLVQPRRPYKDD